MRVPILFIGLMIFLFGCDNLEKDIDVKLPEPAELIVVESYLSPGEPFTLSLTKSTDFFTTFNINAIQEELAKLFVNDAQVVITTNERSVRLNPFFAISPKGVVANYFSPETMTNSETEAALEVTLSDGRTIHGYTELVPKIEYDSIVIQGNGKRKYRFLTYFTDPQSDSTNYFRSIISHRYKPDAENDGRDDQDILATDELSDTETIAFGTGYDFSVTDTLMTQLWHINREYYDFLSSVSGAFNAANSPFGAPGRIFTNLEEKEIATGIFTSFYVTADTIILSNDNVPRN